MWTEYIPTFSQVEYMELPRMAALADIQWTNPEHKDYQDFLQRLVRMVKIYDVYQYNYAKHVFDVTARFEPNAETGTVDVTLSTVELSGILYIGWHRSHYRFTALYRTGEDQYKLYV